MNIHCVGGWIMGLPWPGMWWGHSWQQGTAKSTSTCAAR